MTDKERGVVSEGAGLVWRRQGVLWWIFVVNLILGLLGTMGVSSKLGAVLNHSLEAQRLVKGMDMAALGSLAMQPSQPFNSGAGAVIGAVVFFIFMLFVEGGFLEVYRQDRKLAKGEFFEAAGRFFWRFVRLLLYSLIVFVPLLMIVSPVFKAAGKLGPDSGKPVAGFVITLVAALATLFLMMAVRLWFDVAQVHAVAEDERAMRRSLRRAFKLTFGNFGSLYWMYLRISLVAWIALAAAFWVWVKLVPPPSVGMSFVLGELVCLLWLGTRLWQRAAETLWYQRRAEPAAIPAAPAPYVPAPAPIGAEGEASPEMPSA
ncbi:MAG TPA: hypothetical protein VGW33_02510 [Terriglobia bacterium]|nr:hypothetical protein [Terriglobia bacterium]